MKHINKLITLVIVGMICISATVITTTVVKPATPVSTVCIMSHYTEDYNLQSRILEYVKKGYITKTVAASNYGTIVIMEKY